MAVSLMMTTFKEMKRGREEKERAASESRWKEQRSSTTDRVEARWRTSTHTLVTLPLYSKKRHQLFGSE